MPKQPADAPVGSDMPALVVNPPKAQQSIAPHGLFATPASMDEVHAWIERHPKEDRIHLYTAAYMTWNFLANKINGGP